MTRCTDFPSFKSLRCLWQGRRSSLWFKSLTFAFALLMAESASHLSGLSALMAGSRAPSGRAQAGGSKAEMASDQHREMQEQIEQTKGPWREFQKLLATYKTHEPSASLDLIHTYLARWPESPVLDSVRLMATQCAIQLGQLTLAYDFCSSLSNQEALHHILDLRMKLLCDLERYSEARHLFLGSTLDHLSASSVASAEFYMAEALYRSLHLDPTHLGSCNYEPMSGEDLQLIEQALSHYERSRALIGYGAALGYAECSHWLGKNDNAAAAYLSASDSEQADRPRLLYLAALALEASNPLHASEIAKKACGIDSPWKGPTALLWMKIASGLKNYSDLIAEEALLHAAAAYNPYEAYAIGADAYGHLQKIDLQMQMLSNLLKRAFSEPQARRYPAVQQAFAQLCDYVASQSKIADLNLLIDQYGMGCGRDELYFDASFRLAQLAQKQGDLELALKAYSRLTVQCPAHKEIASCLLQRGLIESKLGKLVDAWSSLDLYLRNHAQAANQGGERPGLLEAWPTYLALSVDLYDYPLSKHLNLERFDLVLDHLAQAPLSADQKHAWIYNQATAMDQAKQWSQAAIFLDSVEHRHKSLVNPVIKLLALSCHVQVDKQFTSYLAQVQQLCQEAPADQKVGVELAFVDRLDRLAASYPDQAPLLKSQVTPVLNSLFDLSPQKLGIERLLMLYRHLRTDLVLPSAPSPWSEYFPDSIYLPDQKKFAMVHLSPENRAALQRVVQVGKQIYTLNPQADSQLSLDMGFLAYLARDFDACAKWIPSERLTVPQEEAKRLALICALSQFNEDTQKYWDSGRQLLNLMNDLKAPAIVRLNFEMSIAREAALRARCVAKETKESRGSSKSKSTALTASVNWKQHALDLFEDVDNQRQAATEPLHMEAAIEKARLVAWKPQGEDPQDLERALIAVKLRYMEESPDFESYQQQMLAQDVTKRTYYAYMVLLDAMLAQDEFKLGQVSDSVEELKLKLKVATTLYRSLQKDHYLVTLYLGQRVQEGLDQISKSEQSLAQEG